MKPDISAIPEREPVMIPPRPKFSKATRLRIWLARDGVCGICGEKIFGKWDLEHRIPRAISGRDDDENLYPAHVSCHAGKTPADRKAIAKSARQGGETGQKARRDKRGGSSIPTRPDGGWPKSKRPLRSRGFEGRGV